MRIEIRKLGLSDARGSLWCPFATLHTTVSRSWGVLDSTKLFTVEGGAFGFDHRLLWQGEAEPSPLALWKGAKEKHLRRDKKNFGLSWQQFQSITIFSFWSRGHPKIAGWCFDMFCFLPACFSGTYLTLTAVICHGWGCYMFLSSEGLSEGSNWNWECVAWLLLNEIFMFSKKGDCNQKPTLLKTKVMRSLDEVFGLAAEQNLPFPYEYLGYLFSKSC